MQLIDPRHCALMVVDIQSRLMPVIHNADTVIRNTQRLLQASRLLDIPRLFTEHNAKGLGRTDERLDLQSDEPVLVKMTFDACRALGADMAIPTAKQLIVTGCEAHVCVLQTVFGLVEAGKQVFVTSDAIGSRTAENRDAALRRMAANGVEIVSTEMVLFEWLGSADHPRFRDVLRLIK
ncbi:isochorismatase family protein [Porticoccus litoralis]|uniref:Isochorismatase family protein n=1 Tax=Porticoccus litoralis TaxID=434086 RepID=A0AAW8B5L8_9GAMM|nr:isochorismatase family protein [Porticoccus litoralis]MDP1520886.1 isochorismatase family protein [Porticoccus litoralis]TNE85879.1 MAG: isochorismatase family protein [Gammaproteobacteria bacterium]